LTRPVRFPLRRIRRVAGPIRMSPSRWGPLLWFTWASECVLSVVGPYWLSPSSSLLGPVKWGQPWGISTLSETALVLPPGPSSSRALQLHYRVWLQRLVTSDRTRETLYLRTSLSQVHFLVRPSCVGCPPRGWAPFVQKRSVTRADRFQNQMVVTGDSFLGVRLLSAESARMMGYSVASAVPFALRVSHPLSDFRSSGPGGFVSRHIHP